MSTIVTIAAGDVISASRADLNTNFSNLNTDKIETSVLDTDTSLAANSDSKVATQKAVKAYADAQGNVNASTTARGIVEEATQAEIAAGTAAGGTSARLFVNPSQTINTSAGAGDAGKVVKVNASGKLDATFKQIRSGTTTHNAATEAAETVAHGLGYAPAQVTIFAGILFAGASTETSSSMGCWDSTGQRCISITTSATTGGQTNLDTNSVTELTDAAGTKACSAVLTVDATNITLTWTKVSTPTGTVNIVWQAE